MGGWDLGGLYQLGLCLASLRLECSDRTKHTTRCQENTKSMVAWKYWVGASGSVCWLTGMAYIQPDETSASKLYVVFCCIVHHFHRHQNQSSTSNGIFSGVGEHLGAICLDAAIGVCGGHLQGRDVIHSLNK